MRDVLHKDEANWMPQSTGQPAIGTQVSNEALYVAANLAQAGEVEVSIGMHWVKFYATLVGRGGRVISLQLFKDDRTVEVKQCVIGEVMKCVVENGQRIIAARLQLAQQDAQIGVCVVMR